MKLGTGNILRSISEMNLIEWFVIQANLFKQLNLNTKIGIGLFFGAFASVSMMAGVNLMSTEKSILHSGAYSMALKAAAERDAYIESVIVEGKKPIKKPLNEAVPKAPHEYDALQYIAKYAGIAVSEQKRTGVLASITLAQGLVESRGGTSMLAAGNNNHFGIKCFSKKCRKGHCSNFTDDTHKDFFRKFKTVKDSFRAHSDFLKAKRYKILFRTKDYRIWAVGLKQCGYATDPDYAYTIAETVEKYNLNKYDR
jgi:flagellum-specific peptidoglycan hydrolase FlgJ